jgi:dTDP-D-glucose 4,6-dehydratase
VTRHTRNGHQYAIEVTKIHIELQYALADSLGTGMAKTLDWHLHNEKGGYPVLEALSVN